ncbi:MAG: hypothetical protein ABIS67_14785 [Candidatus Eisenbacteria bacterium]
MGRGSAARAAGRRTGHGLNESLRRGRSSGSNPPPAPPGTAPWFETAADLAALALVVFYLVTLAQYVAGARLQTDECFHATMSGWIATHGTLPRVIPELYSGFAYFYPPLFHLLGALWIKAFGTDAFRFLNVFVTALLLAWVVLAGRPAGGRTAVRWAVLLCIANSWLAHHAMRLYVEQLTTLLAVGAVLLILELRRSPRPRVVLALGVVAGLAVLAKLSMLLLVALLVSFAGAYALRRERAVARAFAMAGGIALVTAAPLFLRNALLFGSPIYPALAPDQNALLYELNRSAFTPHPAAFYLAAATHAGVAIGLMVLAAFAFAAVRRRFSLEVALLGFCMALYFAGPLQPLLDPRHLLPVIAVAAVLSSRIVALELDSRPSIRASISVALLLLAGLSLAPMTNQRKVLDLPAPLVDALEAVRLNVPEGETVLSLWTYDTYYYSHRPATWPIPWSQKHPPVEMFLTGNCDSVMLALQQHQLRYLLVPRQADAARFTGVNYPRAFLLCVGNLVEQQRLEVLWSSPTLGLVKVAQQQGAD